MSRCGTSIRTIRTSTIVTIIIDFNAGRDAARRVGNGIDRSINFCVLAYREGEVTFSGISGETADNPAFLAKPLTTKFGQS
jgi:hypothetical protein